MLLEGGHTDLTPSVKFSKITVVLEKLPLLHRGQPLFELLTHEILGAVELLCLSLQSLEVFHPALHLRLRGMELLPEAGHRLEVVAVVFRLEDGLNDLQPGVILSAVRRVR